MLRPVAVYDGRCRFCRRWVARWKARTGWRVIWIPLQTPLVVRWLGVSPARARRALQLVETDGAVHEGAAAVFRALTRAGGGLALAARIGLLPVVRQLASCVYRLVARHRRAAAELERSIAGAA